MELQKQILGGHYDFPKEYWNGISDDGMCTCIFQYAAGKASPCENRKSVCSKSKEKYLSVKNHQSIFCMLKEKYLPVDQQPSCICVDL